MSLEDATNLTLDADFLNMGLCNRDVNVCFAVSMMTNIQELDNDRHIRMSLIEF
jgi:hypothetical protein